MLLSLLGGGEAAELSFGHQFSLSLAWLCPYGSCPILLLLLPQDTALQSHALWLLNPLSGTQQGTPLSTLPLLVPKGGVGNEQGRADHDATRRCLPWVVGTNVVLNI